MDPARWSRWIVIVAMMMAVIGSACTGERRTTPLEAPAKGSVQVQYASLPLHFEANRGQTDSQVQFLSRGRGYSLFLTPTEAVLVLQRLQKPSTVSHQLAAQPERIDKNEAAVLRMKLLGTNPTPRIKGMDELPGKAGIDVGLASR